MFNWEVFHLEEPIKNEKVYEQVIDQIEDMVADGSLGIGDKLPSERELVERLKVSRTSIREALRALEVIGLIESRQGEGNFIKSDFGDSFFQPLSVMFSLQKSSAEEMLEFRKIMEVETAALSARRINNEELSILSDIISKFQQNREEDVNVKLDKEFHYQVAKASRNLFILNMLQSISSLMDSHIKDARSKVLIDEGREELIKQHEAIFKALSIHDPKAAANSMRKHLDFANKYMVRYK